MLFCYGGCEVSLAEDLVYFLVPSFGRSRDYFHPVNSVREPDRDSGAKVMDDGCGMGGGVELSFDNFELKFPHILWEIVIVADSSIGEPSGGFGGGVCALEGGFKVRDEILEDSKGGGI